MFKQKENLNNEIKYPQSLSFLKKLLRKDIPYLAKLGGYKDGGYVVDFRSVLITKLLISGGIGSNARFESDFKDINQNLEIVLIDPTVSLTKMFIRAAYHTFIRTQNVFRDLTEIFNFISLRSKASLLKKYLGKDFNLNQILKNHDGSSSVFLKIDIEGSEYDILGSIIENKKSFTGLCIEFHDLDKFENSNILNNFLINLDFDIIHISVNEVSLTKSKEPTILEISLLPKGFENWPNLNSSIYYLQNSNLFNTELVVLS